MKKINTRDILNKKNNEKIAMITAYDFIFAKLADSANADMILVGDSVGNTFLGHETTVPVDVDTIIHHTKAVIRANTKALVVSDMPFCCAHYSIDILLDISKRIIQEGGAMAIKIEGGSPDIIKKIKALSDAGIAVMGHIGLEPQQILKLGTYRKAGKNIEEKNILLEQAKELEQAGVFSLVIELTDTQITKEITESINIPTIGIGSGSNCDGQVLVCTDILGLSEKTPSFAKQYANLKNDIHKAFSSYVEDVKNLKFPN